MRRIEQHPRGKTRHRHWLKWLIVAELTKHLQKKGEPVLEGVAITGLGVFETLKELAKLVLAELKKGG